MSSRVFKDRINRLDKYIDSINSFEGSYNDAIKFYNTGIKLLQLVTSISINITDPEFHDLLRFYFDQLNNFWLSETNKARDNSNKDNMIMFVRKPRKPKEKIEPST